MFNRHSLNLLMLCLAFRVAISVESAQAEEVSAAPLADAAEQRDGEEVTRLLKQGADLNLSLIHI